MDGRDCGPPRSVHLPPPLLTGLAMESHRLGAAAAAGRIPPSPGHLGAGHSASLHTGKYLSSAINIRSHHGDAFPVGSSPFLGSYVGSSNPHAGPAPMTSDPSFRAPNPTNLQMAQLWASHLHEGFSHLPGSLYPSSYIPLGHLEHPSSGSSLHAQFGPHPLFEPPKEGFYLPGHGGPSTLHSQSALSRTPAAHTPSTLSREREAPPHGRVTKDTTRDKDRLCRAELGEPHPRGLRDEDGPKEEPRPRSVVDLTDDERRSNGPHRPSKKASPFISDPSPGPGGGELRPGVPLQTSSLSNCRNGSGAPPLRPPGLQQDGFPQSQSYEDENTRPTTLHHGERAKKCDPATTSSVSTQHLSRASPPPHGNLAHLPHRLVPAGAFPLPPLPSHLPPSLYPLYPTAKDPGREHRVIAPTFVPSVEVYEDRLGPAQITTQTRENKSSRKGEKDLNRQASGERIHMDLARLPAAHEPFSYNGNSTEALREEGSVIRSNCMPARRPTLSEAHTSRLGCSPDTDSVLSSTASKEPSKLALESKNGSQDHDRIQRAPMRGGLKYAGVEPTWLHPEQPSPKGVISTEHKWKPLDMNKYASGQMSALVAQHGKAQRGEEDGKNAYLDHSGVHRPAPGGSSRGSPKELYPEPHREVSAMQSLIKYSGSFAKGPSSRPGSDSRSPFGGLGSMKLEGGQSGGPKTLHIPPHQLGKQLKRDPERPESAKSFGRESIGSQGEVEVRHPPVGIAVAVARQRENGSKPGLGDRERPLMGSIKGSGHTEEDRGDEGVREDRLLPGRLEREQEKLLRENKELADYTQMHLPEPSRLNPNLMVTGGPPLTSASRWPPDPASHVMSHPWLPRPSGPSMWTLSGSPYGLGPSSLHQGLPPGYPPALPGSIPPSYQFAQDPQSGQLVVIPTEHLPHYAAELMERSPPLWPGLYPGAGGASLHHAQELHLLSQQQLLRQQELLLIQQQAAQVMELQRSAQLAERLKESEQRAEMEDKLAKRSADGGKQGISARAGSTLSSRKLPSRSPTPTPSYSKALTPLPSPITSLKSECGPKAEKSLPEPSYSHPSTPAPRPVSPAPAPPAPVPPKEECVDVCESQEPDLQNHVSTPIRALYPEIPPGYPYKSLPGPYGSHYPYLLQPAAAADADGLAPDVPLPAETPERSAASADVKPWRLRSPTAAESSSPPPRKELRTPCTPEVKEEPGLEDCRDDPKSLVPRRGETTAPAVPAQGTCTGTEEELEAEGCSAITPTPAAGAAMETAASGGRVKLEETTPLSCQDSYPRAAAEPVLPEAEVPSPEASPSPAALIYHPQTCLAEPHELDGRSRPLDPVTPQPAEADLVLGREQPADGFSEVDEAPCETRSLLPQHRPSLSIADIVPDDPMAGMIALVTASELPQACPLTTFAGELPLGLASLELAGLEGMTLLGEMAELELERQRSSIQPAGPCGLDALLMAGEQVLLEELHRPPVTIRLPRELNPNRKYSWMHKKEEEPLFSKSALEGMDIMEVEYRMRLAELQRRYKDRQRELAKLQRHREREEKQQQQLEESSRAAARRGPGRPRKRRHSLATPSPPTGKPEARTARFSKSLPLSEDSEAGEVLKKRFRGPSLEEDEEMERAMKVKRKSKRWADGEAASSFPQEMQMKSGKKRRVSEQEQLATKLDQALSLTKLGKLHRAPLSFRRRPLRESRVQLWERRQALRAPRNGAQSQVRETKPLQGPRPISEVF
ncbi:hypothetical protein GJAV_G00216360 [Gymnothorax javanicus]|nr:hypothetical protein GJAV_G00216360 [Gymnothorax javanicus]